MNQQPHPANWQSHRFRAMGSQIVFWLECDDTDQAAVAFAQAEALFHHNETILSRFRPDSELMQLNAQSGQWVVVSDLLWREITLALEMAWQTNGRFDPTLLKALVQAGYVQSFGQSFGQSFVQMREGEMGSGPESGGVYGRWREIELDKARQSVYLPSEVQIDLGGSAKGDTAQQAMALLSLFGPGLVDAGGDLAAGAAPAGFPGWPVAIAQPGADAVDEKNLATFWLANGAIATSGIDYRQWWQGDHLAHHLIDPLTGQPAETDVLTVTVIAAEAVVAEAWATATLIAGTDGGIDNLLERELAGLIVGRDGRILATPQMDQLLQGEWTLL